jgi:surface polysaccharide O-acyltransferase-like enzyme
MMAPYSVGAIAFLYWLALTLAERATRRKAVRTERVWHQLSDAAFGVYLVHPIFIGSVLFVFVPLVRWTLPTGLTIFLVWVIASVCSVALTVLLLRTPVLSRLVGRPGPTPRWLATLRAWWSSRAELAAARFTQIGAAGPAQEQDQ